MEASFVIPLFNCLAHTREALRTLQSTLPAGLRHEIILVDDDSTDGTREWLRTLPAPARAILNERNLGFAGACNRGAAAATGELLFFLNNDLVFLPGWFEPMRTVFTRHPDTGLAGNVQLDAATGAVDHAGVHFDHKAKPAHLTAIPLLARLAGVREVPALTGACFAMRAAAWKQLGGFDDGFLNGGEDVDLCLRARAAGLHNRVALRSVVRHHVSASPGRKLRDERNSRRLFERWRGVIAPLAARAWGRHYLVTQWHGARDTGDFGKALRALLHGAGWPGPPSEFTIRGAEGAIATEMARWAEILDGCPPPSPLPSTVRTNEI